MKNAEMLIRSNKTVKFKNPAEKSSTLTIQDNTIASLKALITDLDLQIASLSNRIADLSGKAQKAIGDKNRASALAALRHKKLNESTLAQRTKTLSELEQVFHKIEQAADQVAIIKIMESSKTVLESLHTEVGGIDRVENVVDGLREEMSKVDEIGNVIEAGGPPEKSTIDENAVDEELDNMLQQAKAKEELEDARRTQQRLAEIEDVKASRADSDKHNEDTIRTQIPTSPRSAETKENNIVQGINALNRLSLENGSCLTGTHDDDRTASVPELASVESAR